MKISNKIEFTPFAQAATNNGRICAYLGISLSGVMFAAKKQELNNNPISIKTQNLIELLAWIGFDELGLSLHQTPEMQKKYNLRTTVITPRLAIQEIKGEFCFFINAFDQWIATHDYEEVRKELGGTITPKINEVMGKNFLQKQREQWKHISQTEIYNQESIRSIFNKLNKEQSDQETSHEEQLPITIID